MSALPQQKAETDDILPREAGAAVQRCLRANGVAVLPPMDVRRSTLLMATLGLRAQTTMLDPWYNKGAGGVRDDYREFVVNTLSEAAPISDHIYLWGFPEIVAGFVERIPPPLSFVAWLTWYYKNNPSVIRGWRSAQMACLHVSHPGARMYPEHFLNEAQKQKQAEGKLRYMPGPPSVIEAALLVGFVGRKEQTGHPAQKPVEVYKRLYEMTTKEDDIIFDPMSGSGTTGVAARSLGRKAILCDHSEEYTQIIEKRLGVQRLDLREFLRNDPT
jgi:hypothetical protein